MRTRTLVVVTAIFLVAVAYYAGTRRNTIAYASEPAAAVVPKSYGKLITAIPDSIGTGLVFEDSEGTIRFVSVTGMKEGELPRYEGKPSRGGIPKSYGH